MEKLQRIGKDLCDLQAEGAKVAKNLEKIARRKGELVDQLSKADEKEVPLRDLIRQLEVEKRYLRKLHKALGTFIENLTEARGYLRSLELKRKTGKELTRYLDLADELAGKCKEYLEARRNIVNKELNHASRSKGRSDPAEFKKLQSDLKKEVSFKRHSYNAKTKLEELKAHYKKLNKIPELHEGGYLVGHFAGVSTGTGLILFGYPIIGFLTWMIFALIATAGVVSTKEMKILEKLTQEISHS